MLTEHEPDNDAGLARRVANGDESAFEELVGKYQRSVLNTIHRYVGEYDVADDIAQEVFVILWNKAGTFKGNSKFSTWLYRIVVNQCLQFRRKRKLTLVSLSDLDAESPPEALQVADDHDRQRRTEAVRKAVAELPDRQRIALALSHFEGRTYLEIAETMDTSVSAVESLIIRARENLRSKLLP
jgi:RNA polymerase sigma-70 factor (ECF subfamily)